MTTALNELWAWGIGGVLLAATGVALSQGHSTRRVTRASALALMAGLTLAGLLSAILSLVQVLMPSALLSPTAQWWGLLTSHLPGRAVAHLRQPNHLATLLVWSAIALAAWAQTARAASEGDVRNTALPAAPVVLGLCLLSVGVVLSGSRTGALGLCLLPVWAWRDRQMVSWLRTALAWQPVVALLTWGGLAWWETHQGAAVGAASHWGGGSGGDVSSSRFAIWANTWSLIREHPWAGVGWGQFNLAWSLTPFPGRPTALFDHTHNFSLQWMVELGLPIGMGISILALTAWLVALRSAWSDTSADGPLRRGSALLLTMVVLHSQLEYPLWYSYFLVPSAAAWLLAVQPTTRPRATTVGNVSGGLRYLPPTLLACGVALTAGTLWAVADYRVIHAIYAPSRGAASLQQRMAQGQSVTWFRSQADYAVATNQKAPDGGAWPPALEAAFRGAPGVLVDARLLIAWSQALLARNHDGDEQKARYLIDRLREFRPAPGSIGARYLEGCNQAIKPLACEPLTPSEAAGLQWRSFIP